MLTDKHEGEIPVVVPSQVWEDNLYRCTLHLDINVLRSPTDALIY